jgi:hypothetical protein
VLKIMLRKKITLFYIYQSLKHLFLKNNDYRGCFQINIQLMVTFLHDEWPLYI